MKPLLSVAENVRFAGALAGGPAAVADALGMPRELVGVDRGDALLVVADEAAAVEALRALVSAGLPVLEYAPAQSALEASFLALRHPDPPSGRPSPTPPPSAPPSAPQEGGAS